MESDKENANKALDKPKEKKKKKMNIFFLENDIPLIKNKANKLAPSRPFFNS